MEENVEVKSDTEVRALQKLREAPAAAAASSAYGYRTDVDADEERHLRDYWRSVRKRLWLVIGITVLVTMLSAIYVARKPDIYESQARVQVDLENSNQLPLGNNSKSGAVVFNNPVNDPAYFNTQLQILTSPGLLRRVVKTLDLEHNQSFLRPQTGRNTLWQNLARMVGLGGKAPAVAQNETTEIPRTDAVAPPTSRDDLVEAKRLSGYVAMLQGGLKVEPVKETRTGYIKETRLIDIRFAHPDPQISAKVVNAIADAFALLNLERKTVTNSTTGDFLQRRVAELQSQIRNGEERLVNYAGNNQITSLDANQNTVVDRLAGLNRQLLEAENERKLAEAAYRSAQTPGAADALSQAAPATQAPALETKIAELKQKRAQLLVKYTEDWPEVVELDQQLAVLEKQLRETRTQATSTVVTNLKLRYEQALERENALRSAFEKQRGETLSQNQAAINYRIIQQEIETNKNLLDGLLQRSKENDVLLAGTPNNIRVVDYALAPEEPVGPSRMRSVALAFFFSLAFGIGFALFLEYLDDTVHSADDVEKMLRLPALAVIPTAALESRRSRRRLNSSTSALQLRNGNGHGGGELLINADPRSALAEAYRQLRTSVLLSTAGRSPKTLLVTSSVPAEGKTTTAVNTAICLAQTEARVLIIDADMRRPRLHDLFDIENRRGLSTILSSEITEAEMLSMIGQHEQSGLHLLTSGPVPPNPAELLGSEQMRRLLEVVSATFTHVIIDSPPIASFTDGVLISAMVDGVLLVVHGGKSSRNIVRRTRQTLRDVGAKILGVVLNNVNLHADDYYYYRRYYDEAYYKAEEDADEVASGT
ncbi:MAG TPA: polysaccharide biosynthesis tyrosine autokinase [Pyrinomonadaceae bacterium]|jgi:capsular exopolysaccharide synthesis family protein|nr:polysaccharide biosynthesis tyrosine autokinase [Pyrinomonadaceae bacterium]